MKVNQQEVIKLANEEAKRIIDLMDKEMDILIAKEEGQDARLPYTESYNEHWHREIEDLLIYFYQLGKRSDDK